MQKTIEQDVAAGGAAAAPRKGLAARLRGMMPQRRFVLTVLVALLGPLVAAGVGAWLYYTSGRFVSTDNAYVKADKIAVSADVPGRVVEVMVKADQPVRRGDVLFRLDAEPFRLALAKAEAELDQTRARVEALRAEYGEAQSEIKEAQERVQFYEAQRSRQKRLAEKGVGKAFVMEEADSNADAARARVSVARQKMQRAMAQLSGDAAIATQDHPLVRERIAARDRAKIDLDKTTVRAPATGIVTNFDMQRGEYVGVGSTVFSLVGSDEIWVQANFKETDLTWVEEGQRATIHVDTYPGKVWKATVASISPATGAEFAVLPPQNATGNWVKVVQRLPVRLKIEAPPGAKSLRAGMSVLVEIDTRHDRPMPGWLAALLGRAKASQ